MTWQEVLTQIRGKFMGKEHKDDCKERNCCCCYGPQGPAGPMGPQGMQGLQGPPGQDGKPGSTGPMGPQGPQGQAGQNGQNGHDGKDGEQGPQGPQGPQGNMGPMGPEGPQGQPGKDCDCHHCCPAPEFCATYSLTDQLIAPGAACMLDLATVATAAFDLSSAAATGEIKVLKHGWYALQWGFDGVILPPIPTPVPAFSLSIYKNGVQQPSSSSGSFAISPDDICTNIATTIIIECGVGDLIKLVNTSTMTLKATAVVLGSAVPLATVRVNMQLLKELP